MKAFGLMSLFTPARTRQQVEIAYLNQSVSMTDLERRQREIARGKFRGL